jgi:hypothetical protein
MEYIKIPDNPESFQVISLSGQEYVVQLTYNTADAHWRLSLLDLNYKAIVAGLKVMPSQNLTWRYRYIEGMPSGNIYCMRYKNDFSDVGRDNLGLGKTYQLVYLTEQEDQQIGFN